MDFFIKPKPKLIKCCSCKKVLRENIRSTSLTIKDGSLIQTIKICEKCLYRLPVALIRSVLNTEMNKDFSFGNKILSALLVNKYRNLNNGYVVLMQVPHVRSEEIDLGCSYKFTKISNPGSCNKICREINPLNKIDSVYVDGEKVDIVSNLKGK